MCVGQERVATGVGYVEAGSVRLTPPTLPYLVPSPVPPTCMAVTFLHTVLPLLLLLLLWKAGVATEAGIMGEVVCINGCSWWTQMGAPDQDWLVRMWWWPPTRTSSQRLVKKVFLLLLHAEKGNSRCRLKEFEVNKWTVPSKLRYVELLNSRVQEMGSSWKVEVSSSVRVDEMGSS